MALFFRIMCARVSRATAITTPAIRPSAPGPAPAENGFVFSNLFLGFQRRFAAPGFLNLVRLPILLLLTSLAFAQTADLAVINARIYTVNPRQPNALALAVRQGKILTVSDDVTQFIGPSTKIIDAHDAAVLPGLIDSHGHMRGLGTVLETLDLRGITSEGEISDKVRVESKAVKPGEWILGSNWDQNLWTPKQFPGAAAISAAAPMNPVALTRVDGHAVWANAKAMEAAGITSATADPPGGRILRDSNGHPSGVFLDNAQDLIRKKIPADSPAQIERRIRRAMTECARQGLTAVDDAGVDAGDIDAYRKLAQLGQMPTRIYALILGPGPYMDTWLNRAPESGDYLTIRAIKLVSDGALGSRGAALLAPYSDDPGNRGLAILDRATIQAVAEKAVAHGFQVATHAIGDGANHTVLEAYAVALRGANDRRFRVEHAQVVAPGDFAAFAKYSILASMQPTHATSDMPWAADRLGPERVKGAYAWQTLTRLGVHVPFGSDFPVESPNPLRGFYAAITRQDKDGHPPGGWFPDQRMTREEALRAFTIEGAYAAFAENSRGSLEPGKFADFVILSTDIMTATPDQIYNARVTKTVVGGKIVFSE
jgi:predicted amidohydrolase YtcJ